MKSCRKCGGQRFKDGACIRCAPKDNNCVRCNKGYRNRLGGLCGKCFQEATEAGVTDFEPSEEELDRMIAEQLPTMPEGNEGKCPRSLPAILRRQVRNSGRLNRRYR